MDFFMDFIRSESIIMIPTLYIINLILRETPRIPVWLHAWIILIIGIWSCMLYYGFVVESFVQGVLVAGVAIMVKDLIHKTVNKDQTKEDDNKH